MYKYYRRQTIAPTFADLRDEEQLRSYAQARQAFLSERLALPPVIFRDADVLEFGPDTGENALVFARWGARMTLVEPNEAAFPAVRAYFELFGSSEALVATVASDVLEYRPDRPRDIIVAEGFIHTVKPESAWLSAFANALVPGGLALVSFYECAATLLELSLKVPYAILRRREDTTDRVEIAQRLYGPKWDRIPHTRAFSSWVMDLLENPYQRLKTFVDAETFLTEAWKAGFGLHSTWPVYTDGLENAWGKRRISAAASLERTKVHVRRSLLSFVLGTKAYLVDDRDAERLRAAVDSGLADAEALIDATETERLARLSATFRTIARLSRAARILHDDDGSVELALSAIDAWADVYEHFAENRIDAAIGLLREEPALLNVWGTPNHHAVLRLDRP